MACRSSRSKNVPARLREETWYLVRYEEDEQLRVLAQDEVKHVFAEDEEDDIQVGDIINALWLPDDKYYDAKVIDMGCDKNTLMKERLRLEKITKAPNIAQATSQSASKNKRKQPETGADSDNDEQERAKIQKKKVAEKENEQKAKEREEKKKKKEEENEKKKLLLETRRAQAAVRWASHESDEDDVLSEMADSMSGDMERNNDLPMAVMATCSQGLTPQQNNRNDNVAKRGHMSSTPVRVHTVSPTAERFCSRIPIRGHSSTSTPVRVHSPFVRGHSSQTKQSLHRKGVRDSSRGCHYINSLVDVVESDEDVTVNEVGEVDESEDCFQDQNLENNALMKRVEKLQRRLAIALKAKTSQEIMDHRPAPGVLDATIANEYRMTELMQGSNVFWYPHQRAYCSAYKTWSGYLNAAIDIFFAKETLMVSCARGNDKKSKNAAGHQPLNPLIINALFGKVASKFPSEIINTLSQMTQKVNMKCVEARRPQRVRVSASKGKDC